MQLLYQLFRDEGEILHAYQDSLGFWTIGVGRLIDEQRGGGISHEEAGLLLLNDIKKHTDAVLERLPWARNLSEVRLGALVNMHFQMGNGLFGFVNTLQLVKEGKYQEAGVAMLQSRWAQQTPSRALRVAEQMQTNRWI